MRSISKSGVRLAFWLTVVVVSALIVAPMAIAAEATPEAAESSGEMADVARFLGAAIAMGVSALGGAYAQGKIGSAAAGTLAENPDVAAMLIVLEALPEVIVLLGFVSALLIINA
jgi:V/A-type H+-transporting ATPase subunit K